MKKGIMKKSQEGDEVSNWEKLMNFLHPRSMKSKQAVVNYIGQQERNGKMKKVKIRVTGKVQQVGFRQYTKELADKMEVAGFVRNEENGDVYCEAIGTPDQIDVFIQKVRESPSPWGKVEKMTVEEDDSIEETEKFDIAY